MEIWRELVIGNNDTASAWVALKKSGVLIDSLTAPFVKKLGFRRRPKPLQYKAFRLHPEALGLRNNRSTDEVMQKARSFGLERTDSRLAIELAMGLALQHPDLLKPDEVLMIAMPRISSPTIPSLTPGRFYLYWSPHGYRLICIDAGKERNWWSEFNSTWVFFQETKK